MDYAMNSDMEADRQRELGDLNLVVRFPRRTFVAGVANPEKDLKTPDDVSVVVIGPDKANADYLSFMDRRANTIIHGPNATNPATTTTTETALPDTDDVDNDDVPIIVLTDDETNDNPAKNAQPQIHQDDDKPLRSFSKLQSLLKNHLPDHEIATSSYDGNCFFTSIKKILDLPQTAKELRAQLMDYIALDLFGVKYDSLTSKNRMVPFGSRMIQVLRCMIDKPTNENIRIYLADMAKDGVYIDVNIGCTAMAGLLWKNLYSYYLEGIAPNERLEILTFKAPPKPGAEQVPPSDCARLVYFSNHYMPLIKIRKYNNYIHHPTYYGDMTDMVAPTNDAELSSTSVDTLVNRGKGKRKQFANSSTDVPVVVPISGLHTVPDDVKAEKAKMNNPNGLIPHVLYARTPTSTSMVEVGKFMSITTEEERELSGVKTCAIKLTQYQIQQNTIFTCAADLSKCTNWTVVHTSMTTSHDADISVKIAGVLSPDQPSISFTVDDAHLLSFIFCIPYAPPAGAKMIAAWYTPLI